VDAAGSGSWPAAAGFGFCCQTANFQLHQYACAERRHCACAVPEAAPSMDGLYFGQANTKRLASSPLDQGWPRARPTAPIFSRHLSPGASRDAAETRQCSRTLVGARPKPHGQMESPVLARRGAVYNAAPCFHFALCVSARATSLLPSVCSFRRCRLIFCVFALSQLTLHDSA
jgi:hypothetical protein